MAVVGLLALFLTPAWAICTTGWALVVSAHWPYLLTGRR